MILNTINFLADAELPNLQAPADYIGGIILAAITAFGGIGFIACAAVAIWMLIQKNIAAAANNQKKKDEYNKHLIGLVISMVGLGVVVPLCGVFASALIGKNMGLTGGTIGGGAKALVSFIGPRIQDFFYVI
ncbi:hypothetical protein [Williamsoniiplasma lucivorax]|uniref:Uncharacterized protein n=1 Tax=Williamsoniiplasma lucivorax TaxID=209274 RepID=A0A2S5RF72_9MOLU|nr:hypothetical protein [Williamsoniiplasma lucivorax]PPE05961.1 hypothetical protein ELUCI_v1c02520 [Williamsoniiplasma lucivorax]